MATANEKHLNSQVLNSRLDVGSVEKSIV